MRVTAKNLACRRGGRTLFEQLAFAVDAGEAAAVTGPNGAGKSSLLRLIAGLLTPAEGRIELEGAADHAPGAAVHLVGHLDAVKATLSVEENLAFARELLGAGDRDVGDALERLGLAAIANLPARMLSAGQRRRLALARLLVTPRPVWLLDEPGSSLDADGQAILDRMIGEHLAAGGLALIATHARLAVAKGREIRLGGGAGT